MIKSQPEKGHFKSPFIRVFYYSHPITPHLMWRLVEVAMQGLTEVEAVFLRLAWFFEAPEQESFNIGLLYHHLENEWLEFALE